MKFFLKENFYKILTLGKILEIFEFRENFVVWKNFIENIMKLFLRFLFFKFVFRENIMEVLFSEKKIKKIFFSRKCHWFYVWKICHGNRYNLSKFSLKGKFYKILFIGKILQNFVFSEHFEFRENSRKNNFFKKFHKNKQKLSKFCLKGKFYKKTVIRDF